MEVAKIDNQKFYQTKDISNSHWADGYYTVGVNFNFDFKIFKKENTYKAIFTPKEDKTLWPGGNICVYKNINKISLSIDIGSHNIFSAYSIIDQYVISHGTCNSITPYTFKDPITFNFNCSNDIDMSNLKISFYCYESESLVYTFEQNFKTTILNKAPVIENLKANFPNVSFKVLDDKKVSKVDVFINDSIYKTISSDLDKEIKLTFNLKDFNVGENKIILKAIDNEDAYTNKTIKVVKEKIPTPKKDIKVVKNNKIYKVVNAEEIPNSEELTLTLDRNLEEVSTLKEPIEILNDYATVKINDQLMNHVSSKYLSNGLVEDKFELDINTRKIITRVDLFRESLKSNIYIKEIQEAFQYYED